MFELMMSCIVGLQRRLVTVDAVLIAAACSAVIAVQCHEYSSLGCMPLLGLIRTAKIPAALDCGGYWLTPSWLVSWRVVMLALYSEHMRAYVGMSHLSVWGFWCERSS